MYNTRSGLLIGFHGCDKLMQQHLLSGTVDIHVSDKPFDWLGHGMYFWENNYERALQWAIDKCERNAGVSEPAVVGAVLDLNYCCDFLDQSFIRMIGAYYDLMALEFQSMGKALPVNKDFAKDLYKDKLMRFLDCETIEFMHKNIRTIGQCINMPPGLTSLKPFDSVRGAFLEGGEAFPGAGISAKTHIQICIRNPNCIKGFFQKREEVDFIQLEISRS
ncbi:MAG: hypothetical protein DI535_08075 [Citrobacter freundii]|nr:MAG: hypothetical protein DI535_08075 [Citrobacter freundii]